MLRIVHRMNELRFSELMDIYIEGNIENGSDCYPNLLPSQQIREAEQDFYQYLNDVFFRQEGSFYALWELDGCYLSALRLEPYEDGLLISALETLPNVRQQGYASRLICAVIEHLAEQGSGTLYSHVSKKNAASLKAHMKCGFRIIKDHAVYSDGSVLHSSYTLAYDYNKNSET